MPAKASAPYPGKRLLAIALLVLVGGSAAFAQSPEVRKAFRFFHIEQPSKGMSALQELVKSNPENSSYHYYLGLAQLQSGDLEQAMANFNKGIELDKRDGLNYAGKGHAYLLEKKPAMAREQFDLALKYSRSKDANVMKAIGRAYLTDTKYLLDAISMLEQAKAADGSDPETHILLGDALLIQNPQQGGPAISSYERAASADPKSGTPHYKIGRIWQQARGVENAIAAFQRAIEADPEYAPAYHQLGELYYKEKQYDKAVAAYDKYLPLTENPGNARFQQAFFLFMAKKYDKANKIFQEVVNKPEVPVVALKYYAYSLTVAEKQDEALKVFQQYFDKAKQEDIQASDFEYYGKLQLSMETPEGDSIANEYFEKSLVLDSAQVDVLTLHAETYKDRKLYGKAAETYERLAAVRENPLTQDIWNVGINYFLDEQWVKADSALTIVTKEAPNMLYGPLYAARARRQIDSTGALALPNPMYDTFIAQAVEDTTKWKKELIEAYGYFGSYFINIKPDIPKAKGYFNKILKLDPQHPEARQAIDAINEAAQPQQRTRGGK